MRCHYFDAQACRSCTLMGEPYAAQLTRKNAHVQQTLGALVPDAAWSTPFAGKEHGFRNKAKLAVGGSLEQPTLGILDRGGAGIDLRHCGLYEPGLAAALPALAEFVSTARLVPYDLTTRRGELKNLIVTHSPDGELMVRFVLRSQEPVARLRKHLPLLRAQLLGLVAASANILPEHKAVLEGELEIPLTDHQSLPMRLGEITLNLRPRSFFQTNTEVATGLYAQARDWTDGLDPQEIWDLYCGVGGFALHLAAPGRRVTGVESSTEAIRSAQQSAAGLPGQLRFVAGDATSAVRDLPSAGLVVVNPPRRGIGPLAPWLEQSGAPAVLYSSCNARSLAADLERMPSFHATRARMFDMFPQTEHHEVLVLLTR